MLPDCRVEIEVQIVSKNKDSIEGTHLEAALYQLDPEDPKNARLVRTETAGTHSNDHWVSVDTSNKTSFSEAWHGGLIKVPPFDPQNVKFEL